MCRILLRVSPLQKLKKLSIYRLIELVGGRGQNRFSAFVRINAQNKAVLKISTH